MSRELERPTKEDLRLSEEGYFRYLTGVAVLHDPFTTKEKIHDFPLASLGDNSDFKPEEVEKFIVYTESRLVLAGLRDVILYANSFRGSSRGLTVLEKRYSKALPFMQDVVDQVYDDDGRYAERLNALGTGILKTLRPAPFLDETVYQYLCHPRLEKLAVVRLMDPVLPNEALQPVLENRTLNSARRSAA